MVSNIEPEFDHIQDKISNQSGAGGLNRNHINLTYISVVCIKKGKGQNGYGFRMVQYPIKVNNNCFNYTENSLLKLQGLHLHGVKKKKSYRNQSENKVCAVFALQHS